MVKLNRLIRKLANDFSRVSLNSTFIGFIVPAMILLLGFGRFNLQGDEDDYGDGDDIWVMNLDGSDLRKLTSGCIAEDPIWSPDSTRIAFISEVDEPGKDQLHIVYVDETEAKSIALPTNEFESWVKPGWSPDGKHMAYMGYAESSLQPRGHLYLADNDGSNPTKLAEYDTRLALAKWSPDSNRIAVLTNPYVPFKLYTVNIENLEQVSVVSGGLDSPFYWTPDGKALLVRETSPFTDDTYSISADGSGKKEQFPDGLLYIPSPDAQTIAVQGYGPDFRISTMKADGTQIAQVTDSAVHLLGWSNDGNGILFISDRIGKDVIQIAGVDGKNKETMVGIPLDGEHVALSPDGIRVAFLVSECRPNINPGQISRSVFLRELPGGILDLMILPAGILADLGLTLICILTIPVLMAGIFLIKVRNRFPKGALIFLFLSLGVALTYLATAFVIYIF